MPKPTTDKHKRFVLTDRLQSLSILVVIALVIGGWGAYHYATNQSGGDSQRSRDLETITKGITNNYLAANNSLPDSLSDLHLKDLHYATSTYSYASIRNDMGSSSYTLCAQFNDSQGLPFDVQSGNNGSFSVHRKGKQCYQVTYYPNHGGSDIVPVLNPNEESKP